MTESPLLRLPGELRNRIYELAVGRNIIVVTKSYKRPVKASVYLTSAKTSGPDAKSAQVSIRAPVSGIFTIGLVCRQLNREIALIQYANNLFHFDSMTAGQILLDSLNNAQRALLTSISIKIGNYFVTRWFFDWVIDLRTSLDETGISLPKLKHVYFSPELVKGTPWDDEEAILHSIGIWCDLKIGSGRNEGISFILLDVFSGLENRDQAKTIKLNWDGETCV